MTRVIQFLNYVTAAGFVALAVITVRDWIGFRVASRLYLALAIGLLALVDVISEVSGILPPQVTLVSTEISIVGFMGAGYSLLLFRDILVPLKRRRSRSGPPLPRSSAWSPWYCCSGSGWER